MDKLETMGWSDAAVIAFTRGSHAMPSVVRGRPRGRFVQQEPLSGFAVTVIIGCAAARFLFALSSYLFICLSCRPGFQTHPFAGGPEALTRRVAARARAPARAR